MDDHFLQLRVIWTDLPDLIELGIRVRHGDWSAASTAYAPPSLLSDTAHALLAWVQSPFTPLPVRMEAGADTAIGHMLLQFYTINRSAHARCAVRLSTPTHTNNPRPAERWRFELELPTELGLIEQFAHQCLTLSSTLQGNARLTTLPIP